MKIIFFVCTLLCINLNAFQIRAPYIYELKEIADLYHDSWHHTYDTISPHLSASRTRESCFKKWQAYYAKGGKHFILIALQDNRILGVAFAGPLENTYAGIASNYDAEIDKLYILPGFENNGIGTLLFKACLDKLRSHGFKRMVLCSVAKNEPANIFYENKGCSLIAQLAVESNEKMNIYGLNL